MCESINQKNFSSVRSSNAKLLAQHAPFDSFAGTFIFSDFCTSGFLSLVNDTALGAAVSTFSAF